MVTWSADARPTGPERTSHDVDELLDAIAAASDGVWASLRLSRRRLEGESEEEWQQRQREAYRQLAPLLDRAGRLMADASALVQYLGEGGTLPISMSSARQQSNTNTNANGNANGNGNDNDNPATVDGPWGEVPPHPSTPTRPLQHRLPPIPPIVMQSNGNPREGMGERVRAGLEAGNAIMVLDRLHGETIVLPFQPNLLASRLSRERSRQQQNQQQNQQNQGQGQVQQQVAQAQQQADEFLNALQQLLHINGDGDGDGDGELELEFDGDQNPFQPQIDGNQPNVLPPRPHPHTNNTTPSSSSSSSSSSRLEGPLSRSVEEEKLPRQPSLL